MAPEVWEKGSDHANHGPQVGKHHVHSQDSQSTSRMTEIDQIPLLRYLRVDPRPTFVLDLSSIISPDLNSMETLVYANLACKALTALYQRVISKLNNIGSFNPNDMELKDFVAWVKAAGKQESSQREHVSHLQYGYLWTKSVLDEKWLIVSGVKINAISEIHPAIATIRRTATTTEPDEAPSSPKSEIDETVLPIPSDRLSRTSTDSRDSLPRLSRAPPSEHLDFVRNFDWASTPLGPMDMWSSQLRQACEMTMANPDPCTIFWGDDLIMLWNEPYIAIAGEKHPSLFGLSARQIWGEAWADFDPLIDQMRIDGQAFKQEDAQVMVHRNGYLEEGFFNLRVMPVHGDDGSIIGFYEPVFEITKQVLAGRRLDTLLKIGENISASTSVEDLWRLLLAALHGYDNDIVFAALYSTSLDEHNSVNNDDLVLEGTVGLNHNGFNYPAQVMTNKDDHLDLLPALVLAKDSKSTVVLRLRDGSLSESLSSKLRTLGLKEDCRSIIISPLKSGTSESIAALLVIGGSPRREYDDDYGLFIQLLVRQIESVITFVELFEKERALLKEQALYQSELRFNLFAKRANVGIFIFDQEGRVKFGNDAWLELCDLPRDRLDEPMSWVDTIHPDNTSEIVHYWHKIANLEGQQTFEVQYKKPWRPKSGNPDMYMDRTYVVASAYGEVSEDGELIGILGCVTDISHVKWAEKLQSQRLSEALELKRQQENFLDITSHEMRNPLNAILHCASELIEQLTAQVRETVPTSSKATMLNECLDAASTIAYCGKHQKRIIDDVLTVSKLDSDLLSISPLSSRPSEIVGQVLNVFETELRASSIETTTDITQSYVDLVPHAVFLDPHRVIQIIINLFSNAIKFLKGEHRRNLKIVISASKTEPKDQTGGVRYVPSGRHRKDPTQLPEWGKGDLLYLTFSVQDTGPGMTPEEANSLFNRFIQGSPRTHAQYGGSGLGLFISRELAELHGGRIGISSQIGMGSTFDFYVKGRIDMSTTNQASTFSHTTTVSKNGQRNTIARFREAQLQPPLLKEAKSSPSVLQIVHTELSVLIVEDNLINQQILKKLMRKNGYEVSIANHGEEALAIIEASQWRVDQPTGAKLDIVLCDVEMPVMDGKTTVRKIREMQQANILFNNIPVIAVTGNARSEQIKAAIECGFDDVVSKPYEVKDLIARIQKYTTSR